MSLIQDIDDKIARLQEEIRQLRTKRNALMPLCRLPSDILVHIVTLLQNVVGQSVESDSLTAFKFSYEDFNHKWVKVTLVCSHIHRVVLETPILWTTIDLTNRSRRRRRIGLQHTLQRAGDAGLTILVDNAAQAALITPYVSRAKSLRLFPATDYKDHRLARALHEPMPLIQDLDLLYNDLPLRRNFLGGISHTLRNLMLVGARIESSPDLPNLRLLELHRVFSDPGLNSVFKFLQRCPRIEQLTIGNQRVDEMLPFDDLPVENTKDLIPELMNLRIDDNTQMTWTFLSALRSPTTALHIGGPLSQHIMETPLSGSATSVVDYLQSWWKQASGWDDLKKGRISLYWTRRGDRHEMLVLRDDCPIGCEFSFIAMIKVAGPADSVLRSVDLLDVNATDIGPSAVFGSGDNRMGAEHLTGLRNILVHGYRDRPHREPLPTYSKDGL
jgi:hypothetical protein